jgi:hypothetical protein
MMADNLNRKEFGIMDVAGKQLPAGAAFAYRGFIISMSQVFDCPDVAVFLDGPVPHLMTNVQSVEFAINWCNQNQDKKA